MDSSQNIKHVCRLLWVIGLSTCSMLMFVLVVAPFLSDDSKYSISYEVMYWWEAGFLVPSILAMIVQILYVVRHACKTKCGGDNISAEEGETSSENRSPRVASKVESLFLCICGIGSSVLPCKLISSFSSCYDVEDSQKYKVNVASLVCFVFFSIVETGWLKCIKIIKRLKDTTGFVYFINAIAVMLVVLGNVILCARSVLDAIRASTTRAIASRNESMSRHFFDVTLVFSKCSNNMEIVDNGVLTWYRYTYSFPFLFGLLAMKLIFSVLFCKESINNQKPGHDNIKLSNRTNAMEESNCCHIKHKYFRLACKAFCKGFRLVSKYSWIVSLVFELCVFVFRLVSEIQSGLFNTSDKYASTWKPTSCSSGFSVAYSYIYASVPILAYYLFCKGKIEAKFDLNKGLLMICAVGNIFYCLFEMVDSVAVLRHLTTAAYEASYFVSLLFRIMGVFCQIMIIFYCHGLSKDPTVEKKAHTLLHIRGVLIFLAWDNGFRWLTGTIMPLAALKQVYVIKNEDSFGATNWWVVENLFAPTVLLFRLLSSLMSLDLSMKIRHMQNDRDTGGSNIQEQSQFLTN